VAPGELITIIGTNFGPDRPVRAEAAGDGARLPKELAGVRVLFDGVPVPILYASEGRVSVVVPFTLEVGEWTEVVVEQEGRLSEPKSILVLSSDPGIFTTFASGIGQAAARNEDNTINNFDAPAGADSVVVFYATGAGQTVLSGEEGRLSGSEPAVVALPVEVTIGGRSAEVLYAGNAPGLLQGIVQIMARVPAGSAGRQELVLNVDGRNSQAEVWIAVRPEATVPDDFFAIDVRASDIAYDPGTHRLYACVNEGIHADSVAVINPSTGDVLGWIPTGHSPRMLAISDDGHYLYLVLDDSLSIHDSIQRIDLRTGKEDFTIQLIRYFANLRRFESEAVYVSDMQVLPGQPRSLAIAAGGLPAIVIDDDVRRPAAGPPAQSLSAAGPGLLWGSCSGTGACQDRSYYVDEGGVRTGPLFPRVGYNGTGPIALAGNQLISSRGFVMNGSGDILEGEFTFHPLNGYGHSFAYRADTGLAYYAGSLPASGPTNFLLTSHDAGTFRLTGELFFYDHEVEAEKRFFGSAQRLVSVGPAGLATVCQSGTSRIFVFPLSAVRSFDPWPLPPPTPTGTELLRFAIPNSYMTGDPAGNSLFLSVPSGVPAIGNSIISFDVATGRSGNPVWVGSEPGAAAVSHDGRFLHTVLAGSRSVARLKLPELSVEQRFSIFGNDDLLLSANVILSLPSDAKSIIIGRTSPGPDFVHTYGMAVYDDGVPRPKTTPGHHWTLIGALPRVNEAQLSSDGSGLFGVEGEIQGSRMSRWRITPDGIEFDAAGTSFGFQTDLDLCCQNDLCLTGSGYLADGHRLEIITESLCNGDSSGLALMDLEYNRMFVLTNSGVNTVVECFDATSFSLKGRYVIPGFARAHSFERVWGNQLAIANWMELILLPISLLLNQ
jgi:uncharacterized protein (TIGR03437 family)